MEHPRLPEPEGSHVGHRAGRGRAGPGVDGRDSDRRVGGRRVGGDDRLARPLREGEPQPALLAAVPARRARRRRTPGTACRRASDRAAPAQARTPPGRGRPRRRAPGGAADGRRAHRRGAVHPASAGRSLPELSPRGLRPQRRCRVRGRSRGSHRRIGRSGPEALALGAIAGRWSRPRRRHETPGAAAGRRGHGCHLRRPRPSGRRLATRRPDLRRPAVLRPGETHLRAGQGPGGDRPGRPLRRPRCAPDRRGFVERVAARRRLLRPGTPPGHRRRPQHVERQPHRRRGTRRPAPGDEPRALRDRPDVRRPPARARRERLHRALHCEGVGERGVHPDGDDESDASRPGGRRMGCPPQARPVTPQDRNHLRGQRPGRGVRLRGRNRLGGGRRIRPRKRGDDLGRDVGDGRQVRKGALLQRDEQSRHRERHRRAAPDDGADPRGLGAAVRLGVVAIGADEGDVERARLRSLREQRLVAAGRLHPHRRGHRRHGAHGDRTERLDPPGRELRRRGIQAVRQRQPGDEPGGERLGRDVDEPPAVGGEHDLGRVLRGRDRRSEDLQPRALRG